MISRRAVLAGPVGLAALAAGRGASAQSAETITILSNIAHQSAAQGTPERPEGNVQADFERANNARIVWRNIPWPQMRATFLRAISASSSEYDIVMIVDEWAANETLARLPSLEPFAQRRPIDAFEDIAAGMRGQFVADGALRAVPVRSNPQLVHYNTAIFTAAGIQPPRTIQQLIAAARSASGRRPDGAQVYGLGLKGDEDVVGIVRAFGGEILSREFEPLPRREPVTQALTALKELYQAGAIPPNFASTDANAAVALMRDGLLAMTIFGDSYFLRFNDQRASRVAGQVASIPVPGNGPEGTVASTKCAFWGMALAPNGNPARRELAWSFIRALASPAAQLRMAINGNGPVRLAVAEAPEYLAAAPYGRSSAQALRHAEAQIPVFDGSAEVRDIFNEEATQAIAGRKPIEAALDSAKTRIAAVASSQRPR